MAKEGKRRGWWVEPKFQGALIGMQAGVSLLTLGTLWLQVDRQLRAMWDHGVGVGFPKEHVYFAFVTEQRQAFTVAFLVGAVASLVVGLTLTLWMSHRMAGPIARFRRYLQELNRSADRNEHLEELRFREKDFLADLPKLLNQFLRKKKLQR